MPRTKKPSKAEQAVGVNEFDKWLEEEVDKSGKSKQKIVEEIFKDGFLTWTIEDTEKIAGKGTKTFEPISQDKMDSMIADIEANEKLITREKKDKAIANLKKEFKIQESSMSLSQSPPMLTAWAMPNVAEDIDELRRLRREFAPVSRAIDYIKSMIIGNDLDIEIEDPEDKNKKEIRDDIRKFMKDIFQDEYTKSLYTLVSIMIDDALTVGSAGAEIRYEFSDFKFMDFVKSIEKSNLPVSASHSGGKDFMYYKSIEPDWKTLKGISQLKLFKNSNGRLKLYRDPRTWEANYWTLDEIVSQGDTAMAIPQTALKDAGGQSQRFHPWQIFWLVINRRDFDERGMSVIAGVKNIALLLEKCLSSIGEGIYRAGNKKYFIVCGTEKRPWGKPHIRNVMQQIQEMGKRNWTTIPVPYGFDLKSIGGEVFQANQVITVLINLLAQGMHVPTEILGVLVRAVGAQTGEHMVSASFNEIEQMRHEFKKQIENQLFRKQLWCNIGKTKQKQGGKGSESIYVPSLKCSTKGLLSPIDRLAQIQKILNLANPVSPQTKLELERDMADIMGYDNIDFETQEELKAALKKITGTEGIIANPAAIKQQGQPEPQTEMRQQARQAGGVNKGIQGGSRIPSESKKVQEIAILTFDRQTRKRELESAFLDPKTIENILDKEEKVFKVQEIMSMSSRLGVGATATESESPKSDVLSGQTSLSKRATDTTGFGAQITGGNYGPQGSFGGNINNKGYYKEAVIGKGKFQNLKITKSGKGIMSFINPMTQKEVTVVVIKLTGGIAGYSVDMTKIYIDKDVPEWMYLGLIAHESFEEILVETLGFKYEWAHIQATGVERELVEDEGISWKKYDKEYKKLLHVLDVREPQPKNPEDIHISHVTHKGKTIAEGKGTGPAGTKDTSDMTEMIKGGYQHDKGEAGQERVGGFPDRGIDRTETIVHEVNINVKTEPLKITTEPTKSEIVVVQTSKPEVEKALKDLAKQQDTTQKKFDTVLKELNDKQDVLKALQEEQHKENKLLSEEKITAEMTKINMEIVNLEAERRKIGIEIKEIQETAQQKKELMSKIEQKLDEEDKEE